MAPIERCQAASAMYDEARAIVESSLPVHLSRRERRLALAVRMYGKELPEAALEAFAARPPRTRPQPLRRHLLHGRRRTVLRLLPDTRRTHGLGHGNGEREARDTCALS
jgi:hypothetical protein